MSIVHAIDGVDLTAPLTVQLKDETSGFPTAANLGAFESTSVFIGDPEGALSLQADIHHLWTSRETTAASGSQVFFTAYVAPEVRWGRIGGDMVMPVGAGRVWDLDLVESNTLLLRRKIRRDATTTKRPSETVSARVAWVLTTDGMSGVVVDAGLVESSSVVMDPFDYHNQDAATVLRDCANVCAFNFTIRYREATEDWELLFFDPIASGQDISTLVISNVASEVDNSTTFAPFGEAKGHFNGDRIASGIIVEKGDGSDVYVTDAGTAAAYAEIDLIAPTPTISQQSTATTFGNSLLARHSTPEEKVEDEIEVPAASVTIVKAGQLVQAKYTHGPGWESGRYARVTRCIPKRPPNLTQGRYRIGLELQPANLEASVSNCRLYGPNDNNMPVGLDGTFYVNYDTNGDGVGTTPAGCAASPQSGGLTYAGASEEWTGITSSAWGTITVDSVGSFSGSVAGGTVTLTARILVNGVAAYSTQQITSGAGARAISWQWSMLDKSVTVAPGDLIQTQVTVNGMSGGILVIPAGTGACAEVLWARGTLLVAI